MSENSVLFDHHLAQTTMFPFALDIVSAKGIYLYDRSGKRYIDLVSGIGVSHIGHGNQHVIEAIKAQVDRHMHVMVYGEYVQTEQNRAATLLAGMLPASLNTCYFVNSGTEANEAALKLAKRVTRRTKLVAFRGGYHGSTHGSLSVSGNELKKAAFRPLLPDVHFLAFNRLEDLSRIDEHTAGVIVETIQGDAGVRIPDVAFMQALRKRCDETGAQLILDEIQCGMGRTGTMWAFEQFGIVPDILTLGKALGGGLPVGCVVASREKMQQFTFDPMLGHISTFAGHPVVCAAVAANLEVYQKENLVTDVERKGRYIAERLRKHSAMKEIRQRGLFFACDMESPDVVQKMVTYCLDHGLVSFWFLSCPSAFRIAPPLVITDEEIEEALEIIESAIRFANTNH
jgi:acetylornithine/N-succinyldiaminopimelate aminotransferase